MDPLLVGPAAPRQGPSASSGRKHLDAPKGPS